MSESRRSSIYLKKLENEDDIDLLSNLPDSIICLIISKLQTKEAVQTSLLSSRYKSLWVNITSLRFTDRDFGYDAVRLAHFVNRVLSFLKSKSINELCLWVRTPCNSHDIPTWVSAAIYMNVKVLNLVLSNFGFKKFNGVSMPACLYTSKTLELLEIYNRANGYLSLDVPEFVSLPKLTTLHLSHVSYSPDESVGRLISGCSSLEKLTIERDAFDGVTTFTIDSSTLKTLEYSFKAYRGSVGQEFKFELKAPALREFCLHDRRSNDFSVSNLCSLEFAKIHVCTRRKDNIDSHYEKVVQLMQGVHDVNHLWISGDALEALSLASSSEMDSRHSILIMEGKSLQDLLEHSTKLHEFYLSKDSADTTHVVRWSAAQELPVCLLSVLETISVSGFKGRENELSMIVHILKNAKVLKKITISEETSEFEANLELYEKVLTFDRGSESCEIIFS